MINQTRKRNMNKTSYKGSTIFLYFCLDLVVGAYADIYDYKMLYLYVSDTPMVLKAEFVATFSSTCLK